MWTTNQFNLIMAAGLALIISLTTAGALNTRKEIKQGKVQWVKCRLCKDTLNGK
jgi:hypothetical protein